MNLIRSALDLAVQIARHGREGRRVGTVFTLGNASTVLAHSRPLILDPLANHPRPARRLDDPDLRGTIQELAQLDGAFVIGRNGDVEAACRHLDTSAGGVKLPLGLGCRHVASAAISRLPGVLAIAVSQTGIVRAFLGGELVIELCGR